MLKTINRYVPSKVYDILNQSDFKNKEHLYIICDMIYRRNNFIKEETDYSNRYVSVPHTFFRGIITDLDSYNKAMNYLKDNGILLCDNEYIWKQKTLGYKFPDNLISKLVKVIISKPILTKRIIKNRNERNNIVIKKFKTYKDYFLKTFKIDFKDSIEYIDNNFDREVSRITPIIGSKKEISIDDYIKCIQRYNYYYISLSAINDGDLFFKKNDTNGRIDTNLTSLKKELCQFISIKNLYNIDCSNSQPYFLYLEMISNDNNSIDKNELKLYGNIVSRGLYYEYYMKKFKEITKKEITRDEIKNIMFCIFYSKIESYKKEKSIFNKLFPTINDYINKQKMVKYNELAIKMQKKESEICIDIICPELDKEGISYYTKHDSWIVEEKDIKKTKEVIERCFIEKYNNKPNLKEEKINN